MLSWKELEEEFFKLKDALQSSRIDVQWGDSGEYWRIAGGMHKTVTQRFKQLACIAGEKLLEVDQVKNYKEIINENDPEIRWYKGIKNLFDNSFEFKFCGTMRDKKNNNDVGSIYAGSVYNIAEYSANLCLKMMPKEKDNKKNVSITNSTLIFNNINVDRSVVGAINTAEVKQIDITMSKIKNSGNEELTKAVKEFTEAVISETKLNNDTKNQIIELISFLTKQSLLNKEKRQNSIIKAVLTHVESLISTIALLLPLWTKLRHLLNL